MISKVNYTIKNVISILSNIYKIRESAYLGFVENVNFIIDMELLIKQAKLTAKQYKVVDLYYFQQYTQEEISRNLKISQQAVQDHLNKAKKKLEVVLLKWGE